jgi:hypothetical protein
LAGAGIASVWSSGSAAAGVYWLVLVFVTVLGPLVVEGASRTSGGSALFFLMLAMPAVQLAASLVAALVIICNPRYSHTGEKRERLWALGRITLATILGAGAGILIMWLTCNALSARRL